MLEIHHSHQGGLRVGDERLAAPSRAHEDLEDLMRQGMWRRWGAASRHRPAPTRDRGPLVHATLVRCSWLALLKPKHLERTKSCMLTSEPWNKDHDVVVEARQCVRPDSHCPATLTLLVPSKVVVPASDSRGRCFYLSFTQPHLPLTPFPRSPSTQTSRTSYENIRCYEKIRAVHKKGKLIRSSSGA